MSITPQGHIKPLQIASVGAVELTEQQLAKLDPEYVLLHNENYVGRPRVHDMPPHTFKKSKGSYVPGAYEKVPVGSEEEISVPRKYTNTIYPEIPCVVYTPAGEAPEGGWPIIYNIHGGGWVLGSSTSEESLSTRLCVGANAVVVSPEYRMAPDHPYPAAIEDCWEVLLWLWEQGSSVIRINPSRFVIGGASAGGHLSATMINMLIDIPTAPKDLKFKLNLSTVPVTDNTAGEAHLGSPTWDKYESWTTNADGPTLEKEKMLWYRNLFIPNPEHRTDWHASPMLAPEAFWAQHPPTFVGVAEADILRDEGIAYAEKLRAAGVPVTLKVYKGIPHPGVMMAKALSEGRRFQQDLIEAARAALWV
ncbi:Alpha/Beta hydrolase protein [Naematelia encephala]|uniref:Alpha/Beta hydrolase protein n=1 Tax=Naematelia encephala TaxID=71784 RepID=A0A1Y2AEP4_9TREE|nr:Alpha/Beta hydrolase protein [Naematelia encephala]